MNNDFQSAFSLKGRVALITGGASGIGYAIAKCFHAAGAEVIIASRNTTKLKAAAASLGDRADYRAYDVTETEDAGRLISGIESSHGRLDILVNNAGIHLKERPESTTPEAFSDVVQTHLIGSHSLCVAAYPYLSKSSGSILFIASITSYIALPATCAYSSAKSAILGYVRSLATDWATSGIRVNAIAPGWIETPMLREVLDRDPVRKEKIMARTPLGALGSPEDIGWSATYLSSPAARFITGTTMLVDGGAAVGF